MRILLRLDMMIMDLMNWHMIKAKKVFVGRKEYKELLEVFKEFKISPEDKFKDKFYGVTVEQVDEDSYMMVV